MEYKLKSHKFSNQAEFINFIKTILNKYNYNESLNLDDFFLICDLIDRHPQSKEKIGCGIQNIQVRKDKNFNTKQFWIIRTDGSEIDFSYIKAVKAKDKTNLQKFKDAAREAVSSQIIQFKVSANANFPGLHVDHIIPFEKFILSFIYEFNINVDQVKITGDTRSEFMDKELKDSWKKYHLKNASLRILTASENLSRKREK